MAIDLALQSVVFHTDRAALLRTARSVGESVARLRALRADVAVVEWRIADCSVPAVLNEALVAELDLAVESASDGCTIALRSLVFDENLGPSAAHNRLWEAGGDARMLMLMAPDLVVDREALALLVEVLDDPAIGAVSARRIPLELVPSPLSPDGAAERIGGARSLVRGEAWAGVGGHEEAFFLYGNDAHLSAQLRAAGWNLAYQPAAIVHHDNRPEADGTEPRTPTARFFIALGRLILLRTWSATSALEALMLRLDRAREPARRRALDRFRELEEAGQLPEPRAHPLITPALDESVPVARRAPKGR